MRTIGDHFVGNLTDLERDGQDEFVGALKRVLEKIKLDGGGM
jgi:hypothetical protein